MDKDFWPFGKHQAYNSNFHSSKSNYGNKTLHAILNGCIRTFYWSC